MTGEDTIGELIRARAALADKPLVTIDDKRLTYGDAEARSRRILDSNGVGIFFWNLDGRVTDANDRFLEMVGYTREDLQAGQVNCVAMTPPEYEGIDQLAKDKRRK